MDVEGSGRGVVSGTILVFEWRNRGKLRKMSVSITGLLAWTLNPVLLTHGITANRSSVKLIVLGGPGPLCACRTACKLDLLIGSSPKDTKLHALEPNCETGFVFQKGDRHWFGFFVFILQHLDFASEIRGKNYWRYISVKSTKSSRANQPLPGGREKTDVSRAEMPHHQHILSALMMGTETTLETSIFLLPPDATGKN
jgi:hypothetical protein